jgi:hypothetical protein
MPGLITIILSALTPILIARSLVYFEFAITFSTLFKTINKRLLILDPLAWLISLP